MPESLYGPIVDDHLMRPRCPGPLEGATHSGRADDEACGDVMVLQLHVAGGRIERAAFQAAGCPPSLAAGSVLAERLAGLSLAEAAALDAATLIDFLGGLPRGKHHAAHLAISSLARALNGPLR